MASFIKDKPYLAQDRVVNLSFSDLTVCSLCNGILWVPIACKNCETPYCLSCMKSWRIEKSEPTPCPNDCAEYVQRTCPPSISHILKNLQITCRYKSNGCKDTLPYNNLETHEEACGFRLLTCSGCKDLVAKKDFQNHIDNCPLLLITCSECSTIYERQNEENHTETICLRVQLHRLRDQQKQNEQIWKEKFARLENQVNYLMENTQLLQLEKVNIIDENET